MSLIVTVLLISETTVYEEQLETKFSRETENVFTLSLSLSLLWCWRHWCYPLLHFCERDSGGLFHCGVTTNFIFILIPYYPYVHGRFARWRKWRACDVGEAKEGLQSSFSNFTYVTAHSPTLPSLYLRHNSFSNSSVASPTSQLVLQPFLRFSYVIGSSLTSPGEPPMEIWIATNKDEDKISGHSTVEQSTTVSFTELEEG